jgi:hypothetical protein
MALASSRVRYGPYSQINTMIRSKILTSVSFQAVEQGLVQDYKADKNTYPIEVDVRKPLRTTTLQKSK